MSEVVLGVQPSVHAASQAHQEEMGVSTTALYNKLDRVETGVAAALVRDSARLAVPVVHALRASHPRQTPPTHGLRLCIIKPTGFSRPFRECHRCFLRHYRPFQRKKANLLNDALA